MSIENKKSAFSGGTKVEFNSDGTYHSAKPVDTSYKPQKQTPNKKQRRSMSPNKKTFLFGFLGALVACLLVLGILFVVNSCTGRSSTNLGASTNTIINKNDNDTELAEAVAQKCLPSVAGITVYSQQSGSLQASSLGSGVILSEDGYVVTNQHVIDGAAAIKVTANGQQKDADKVGEDSSSDIAVIKIRNVTGLKPIEAANSDDIKIGEWVMAIGSPFGLEQSVSTGIVSATSRSQVASDDNNSSSKVYVNLIQTDAAINPGNSGGALVDKNGQLIGINALITSYSGNYSGVGFAIPSNYALETSKQLIDGKTISHAQLGVSITTIDEKSAKQYGWNVTSGVYVSGVTQGGPAEKAGIKQGDIIIKFNGEDVSSTNDLLLDVRKHNPGETVKLTIYRDSNAQDVDVVLGSDEGKTQQNTNKQQQKQNNSSKDYQDMWKYFFGF